MTQLSPTTVLSDQASVAVQELLSAYKDGSVRDIDEIAAKMRDVIAKFIEGAGEPISTYDPIVFGEPPASDKINRQFDGFQHDINIMQRQNDFIRASAVYMFNVVATEIGLARNEQDKLRNKLKTLELYSSDSDPTIVTFSENFGSDDYLDIEGVSGSKCAVLENSYLTLGREGGVVPLASTATITVLEGSNGFHGNNLELASPTATPTADGRLKFKAEDVSTDNLGSITDSKPNTCYEYSAYEITTADRQKAKNLNFFYENKALNSRIDWSSGPLNNKDTLTLALQFELPDAKTVNYVSYVPYGGADNGNHPVRVVSVETSLNGTDWDKVDPKDIWVATNQNIQSLRTSDNLSINTTVWSFVGRSIKFVRIFTEQPSPVDAVLGHIYYEEKSTGNRVEGPAPSLSEPKRYYSVVSSDSSKQVQKTEALYGKRWSIGIRDIEIQQVNYSLESSIVSKPIHVPGLVDRLALDADIYIPPEFDAMDSWAEFHISGDNGATWSQISRVKDDYLGIPEIIVFNDPTPEAFQETGVLYVKTPKPVESLRVKIVLRRPPDMTAATPYIRSYNLRIKTK